MNLPPGWNRIKVSENLGATTVALVASAVMSLILNIEFGKWRDKSPKMWIQNCFIPIAWCIIKTPAYK